MVNMTASSGGGASRSARVPPMTASHNASAHGFDAPAAEKPQAGRRRTEVVIVGAGDELLIEVGPALGDQFRTFSADTASDIASLPVSAWIGVFDATAQATGRSAFAQLESQYGKQPWIVLCADQDRSNWRDVLSRGAACAVISRGEISVATFAAALAKATQRLAIGRDAPTSSVAKPLGPLVWIIPAVIALVAGAGLWMSHSHTKTAAVAVPHTAAPQDSAAVQGSAAPRPAQQAASAAPPSIETLLSMARVAFHDPAAQLPKPDAPLQGTSALELYGAVLLQQPKNDEALDGVRRLQAVARVRVQNALAAGDTDTAARLLTILQHADFAPEELRSLQAAVAASRLKQLAGQVRAAMTAGNFPVAHQLIDQLATLNGERSPVPELRKEFEARKADAELATAADQVRAAISAGSLLEPEGINARARLLAMRELNRTSPQTLAVQHELLLALLHRAQAAVSRQDFDAAQQTLLAAQDFGSKAELADTRAALDAAVGAKRAADAASAAAKARASAALFDTNAAAAAVILSPKPARALQVDFPDVALSHNVQGYAIVEFLLNPNGSASNPVIVESSPRNTFDAAALAAIKRASFSTTELSDPKKPQRARFRINFTLGDAAAPAQGLSRAPQPVVKAAPPASAGSGPAAPERILSPKPTQPLQVNYPEVALALNRSGYVVVEFILNPDGTPSSPTIVESSPAKIFDYEALMAVKRARFVTTDLADPTKPQRARVRINFKGS